MVTHICHSNILDTGKGEFLLGGQPRLHSKTLSLKTKVNCTWWCMPLLNHSDGSGRQVSVSPKPQLHSKFWASHGFIVRYHLKNINKKYSKKKKRKSNEHKIKIDRNPPQPSLRGTWFLLTYSMSFRRVMQSRFPNEHTFTEHFSSGCRPSGSSTEWANRYYAANVCAERSPEACSLYPRCASVSLLAVLLLRREWQAQQYVSHQSNMQLLPIHTQKDPTQRQD